ncbi:MAG TPA: GAF domain-containing protein [Rickettsiales bacterium]|nr:GAF domain-containing protein [Rickettsiales bacterium]
MQTVEMTKDSYTPPERPTILGMRLSALLEIAIALVVMLLIDAIWLDHTRYWSFNPHPFWFVVLFIACKYGTKEGVIAAVFSSIALLYGNMPEHTISQDSYAYLLYALKLPILWLVSAVAFGELRMMHIRERGFLESSLKESEGREQSIASSYQRVKTLKDQLEMRMAGQLRSSISAYHAAKSMETLSPTEVLKGLEDLVNASLYPEQFSVYLLNNNSLDVALTHGWKEEDKLLRSIPSNNAIYQYIVARQEILSVINSEHERVLGGQAILAGPLLDKETGAVVGMLKIERMNLSDLHLSNIEAFGTICEWAALAMINANKYQTAKSGSIINPDHNLFTQSYFTRYTDYIRSLAERVRFDVSMIAVKLANAENFDEATHTRIARALGDSVDSVLRKVDLAFDHHEKNDEYTIMLPTTNRQGAQVVVEKIRSALDSNLGKIAKNANFTFTVQTVYEKRAK